MYVIGVDYGSDSARAVIINAENGEELASAVKYYPRWTEGKYCVPAENQYRQHPLDYMECLEETITKALSQCSDDVKAKVKAISVDTTGSTPVAVNKEGTPLSLLPEFAENPNAMFILWKDHTAIKEADEINDISRTWGGIDYTKFSGGVYSSEWFWSKILHTIRKDEKVRDAAFSWVEHCDWIPAILTGMTDPLKIKRSRCAAGHKALWHESWGGLPPEDYLIKIDPLLKGLRERLFTETYTSDVVAGNLCSEWANKLGLSEDVKVGVGAFDAHMGAVGGEIEPYTLSKVIGTSTCDMVIAPMEETGEKLVGGICGQVDGSVIPGMLGLEAGQSAFGDIYAWFKQVLMWPYTNIVGKSSILTDDQKKQIEKEIDDKLIPAITAEAEKLPIDTEREFAIDWMNGRRTPWADQGLKGVMAGLSLGTSAPRIFRILVEATCFGSKKIMDRFIEEGVRIDSIIALGGVAKKSHFIMQVLADILGKPIKIAKSEQTVALGAAMFAAVVAGIYPDLDTAKNKMGAGFEREHQPIPENTEKYNKIYKKYNDLGDFIEKNIK